MICKIFLKWTKCLMNVFQKYVHLRATAPKPSQILTPRGVELQVGKKLIGWSSSPRSGSTSSLIGYKLFCRDLFSKFCVRPQKVNTTSETSRRSQRANSFYVINLFWISTFKLCFNLNYLIPNQTSPVTQGTAVQKTLWGVFLLDFWSLRPSEW